MKRLFLAAFSLLPAISHAADDLPGGFLLLYDKSYVTPSGTKIVEKSEWSQKEAKMSIAIGEQNLPGTMGMSSSDEIHIHKIDRDKIRRLLTKGTVERTMTIKDRVVPVPEKEDPLLNIPVVFQRENDTWTARLENGEPNNDQKKELADLERKLNDDLSEAAQMYGTKPRRIGESWEVDASLLPLPDNGQAEGTVILKLIGERKISNQRCAIIKGTIDAVMVGPAGEGESDMKMTLKGKMTITRSLVHYRDLNASLELDVTLETEVASRNGPVKIKAEGPMTMTKTVEISK